MICDLCGVDTPETFVSGSIPSLCHSCHMDIASPTHLEVQEVATPNCKGTLTVEVGRPESFTANFEEETPIRFDYTESEESREQRESLVSLEHDNQIETPSEVWTRYNQDDAPWSHNAYPSFGAPANDLGAWADSGTNVRQQLLNMSSFPNQDDSIYGFTRDQLDSMQAERDELRASNEAQRQQLAAKDAIIEQLRERLDRAKRGR